MHYLLKQFVFTAILAPLITQGMERQEKRIKLDDHLRDAKANTAIPVSHDKPEPDRIELGKKLVEAAEDFNWETVERLINQKADPNQKDENGFTVFMYAIWHNRPDIVRMLIGASADPNQQKNIHRNTALNYAAIRGHSETVQMLIDAGANINQKDDYNHTALMCAAQNNLSETCHIIVQAQLAQIAQRKECVYTILNCLKRVPGGQYSNLRNLFKPILKAMIQEVRQAMLDDINQIKNNMLKDELLALINAQQRKIKSSLCIC